MARSIQVAIGSRVATRSLGPLSATSRIRPAGFAKTVKAA
jgi:hypothetical protein